MELKIPRTSLFVFPVVLFIFSIGCVPKTYVSSFSNADLTNKGVKRVAIVLNDLRIRDNEVFGELFLQAALEKKRPLLVRDACVRRNELSVLEMGDDDGIIEIALTHNYPGNLTSTLSTSIGAYAKLFKAKSGTVLWTMNYGYKSLDIGPDAPMVEEVMKIISAQLIDSIPEKYLDSGQDQKETLQYSEKPTIIRSQSTPIEKVYLPAAVPKLDYSNKVHSYQKTEGLGGAAGNEILEAVTDNPAESQRQGSSTEVNGSGAAEREAAARQAKVSPSEAIQGRYFSVQIGAFLSKQNAIDRIEALKEKGYSPIMISENDAEKRGWYTIHVGRFSSHNEALNSAVELKRQMKMDAVPRLFDGT